jgi:hypothetical protein
MVTVLTTRIPRSPVITAPPTDAPVTGSERRVLKMLTILMFCDLFLMRIALPISASGVSIQLPIVLAVSYLLVTQGDLVVHIGRTRAYLVAMTVCALCGLVAFLRAQENTALTSLLLLLVTYVPFCLGLRPGVAARVLPRLLDRFMVMTTVIAGLAIAQFMLQVVGLKYTDVIGDIVPKPFLMKGFNTSYPVQYGSSLYKSNGFVCLEASFCSQFLALGIIVTALRRGRIWRHVVLILALVSTVSGTGLLLLGAGVILLAIHRGPRFAASVALLIFVGLGVVSLTPASKIFAKRATEVSSNTSSGSLRFVQPYQRMWDDGLGDRDVGRALFGLGPGWADRDASAFLEKTRLPLNYATTPKIVLEYGVVGAGAFIYFVWVSFVRGTRSFVLSGSILTFYLILSGGLLGSVVVYAGMLLVTWHSRETAQPTAPG